MATESFCGTQHEHSRGGGRHGTCGAASPGRSAARAGQRQTEGCDTASPGGDRVGSVRKDRASFAGRLAARGCVGCVSKGGPFYVDRSAVDRCTRPYAGVRGGRLIGTTGAKAIKLPVGNHDLDFTSEEVGYRASRRVAVRADQTTQVRLDAPTGMLSVNATPWAQVFIDNQLIGETPIGNFRAAIGQRQVVFRHPEFGERRATVLVTLKQPARISTDFTKR